MIDDELRALLSVEPAPGFEARVRTRARTDGRPARWRRVNPAGLAIAAAITVAVGIGLLPRTSHQGEAPLAVPSAAQPSAPLPAALPLVVAESTAIAPPRVAAQSRRRTTAAVATVSDTQVPHVQIDRAESRALQQLFASSVAVAVVDVAPPAQSALVIPQIAIEPLALDIPSKGASQ